MIVYGINGSSRKHHKTATLLDKALNGVRATQPEAKAAYRAKQFPKDCKNAYALGQALIP